MGILEWFNQEIFMLPAVKAVAVISMVCALGLMLGKLQFFGIRFGVTFVFFAGILAGALGLTIDHQMLLYAENFGLVIFVYVLGLQVGPGFINSLRHGGSTLNMLSIGLVMLGTVFAMLPVVGFDFHLGEMMGVLCGATTNTPALAAAQQAFLQFGDKTDSVAAALSLAVTYPLGMVGVIIALSMVKNRLLRVKIKDTSRSDEAFIAAFEVSNPAIFHHKLKDTLFFDIDKFVISRIWRDGKAILPTAETSFEAGDRVLIITQERFVNQLTILFGQRDETDWNKHDIDWDALDTELISKRVVITENSINGKHLGDLHLRARFGVNVSRVYRSGIHLVATPDLILRIGDRITVVGEASNVDRVANELGNAIKDLDAPNMVTIYLGVLLGLIVGYIPIALPGMSVPLRLGIAGGPIIVGILIGAFGPRLHMVTFVTASANKLIRSLGLSTYLACLGLDAGPQFIEVVMRPMALLWIAFALVVCILPVVIFAFISVCHFKRDFATTAGMLCGAMANPIALDYINELLPGDKASVAYASVYPLCMFARVIIAQVIVLMCFM